jgi:quinoprotein glucose dehydrogenase
MLRDKAPRVCFFAAQALRRIGGPKQVAAVLKTIQEKAEGDPFLRHALTTTLSSIASSKELRALNNVASQPVKLAALLALRHNSDAGVVDFLADSNPSIRLEAARAIYDQPVTEGLPALAEMVSQAEDALALEQRIQAARYRLGGKSNAERLLRVVLDKTALGESRSQALALLSQWQPKDGRDAFLGRWWPIQSDREGEAVKGMLTPRLGELLDDPVAGVVDGAVALIGVFQETAHTEKLRSLLLDPARSGASRASVLNVLSKMKVDGFPELLHAALKDKNKELSSSAAKLVAKLPASEALELSSRMFERGTVSDAQNAVQTLVQLKSEAAVALLEQWMDRLLAGKVALGVQLDLLEAANKSQANSLKTKVKEFEAARKTEDPLSPWRECLEGGDAKNGLVIFREKDEVGCYRCHKAAGSGGDVGPAMDKIASMHDREYLLRSIVFPNADYAPGYETLLLKLADGSVSAGMLAKEDEKQMELVTPGTTQRQMIPKDKIVGRDRLPSPMPEGLAQILTKRELRDIVAFLASQK